MGESLDLIIQERGLKRKLAVPAVRKGTFDVPVLSGSHFKTINGPDSVIFTAGELLSEREGGYVYAMTCQVPGTIGNSYVGPLLPITAISGLTSALLGDILTAGTADEEDDALRARYRSIRPGEGAGPPSVASWTTGWERRYRPWSRGCRWPSAHRRRAGPCHPLTGMAWRPSARP